ncbi:hypothetical protein, partial [Burkholderia cenocepacia]
SESLTEELEENSKAGEQIELEHADSLRISQFDPSNAESTGQAIDWLSAIQPAQTKIFDLASIK